MSRRRRDGKLLVSFGGSKHHVAMYPVPGDDELAPYEDLGDTAGDVSAAHDAARTAAHTAFARRSDRPSGGLLRTDTLNRVKSRCWRFISGRPEIRV